MADSIRESSLQFLIPNKDRTLNFVNTGNKAISWLRGLVLEFYLDIGNPNIDHVVDFNIEEIWHLSQYC